MSASLNLLRKRPGGKIAGVTKTAAPLEKM